LQIFLGMIFVCYYDYSCLYLRKSRKYLVKRHCL